MWTEYDEVVDRLINNPECQDQDKSSTLQKAAQLQQDKLNDIDRALTLWNHLIEIDPKHKRAQDSIKKILIQQSSWDDLSEFYMQHASVSDLVKTFESQVNSQSDDVQKIDLLFRAADLYLIELDQNDKAVRALEKVFQIEYNFHRKHTK